MLCRTFTIKTGFNIIHISQHPLLGAGLELILHRYGCGCVSNGRITKRIRETFLFVLDHGSQTDDWGANLF